MPWPKTPEATSAGEEETASMSCVFGSNPAPATSIQWLKDGQPLSTPKQLQGPRNSTITFGFGWQTETIYYIYCLCAHVRAITLEQTPETW